MEDVIGKEALVVLTHLSQLMVKKLKEPLSHVHGWVNVQIIIVLTRLYSRTICVVSLISTLRYWELDWYLGLGLDLVQ